MAVCEVLGALMVGGAPLPSSRQRRLLAALTIAHGAVVSSDRLGDIVWTGQPPDNDNALQTYVSRLRTRLGAGSVVRRPPGYALVLPVDAVDAWRFESLVDQARREPPDVALDLLDQALGLWRGAAYAEFADDEFARVEAVRLEELRAAARLSRLDALLDVGRPDEAAADSVRIIEADPYREPVWERRMRALHAGGRTVDAVRAYREYRTRLADETGLEPSADLSALERALLAGPSLPDASESSGSLPSPLTSLVGRETAVDELVDLVASQRLLTLVGPGGVGKTRLAVEVARAHRERAGSAVAFVELAATDADGVTPAVTRCLGLPDGPHPVETLRHAFAVRNHLLVLDNCEHVVDAAAALVGSLVSFAPGLRVLATSRTRLGVAGERTWAVPPLPVPEISEVPGLAELDRYAATRLFLERTATTGAANTYRDDEARSVASICAAVDGLPLGIELAAARTRELPLERIGEDLASRAAVTVARSAVGRHSSLDDAIGWSYELLDPPTQRLMRRLSVFEGGWTVDAAEAVCGSDDLDAASVPTLLADLTAASLVTFDPAVGRYSMLQTVQRFARQRLIDAGPIDSLRDAHLLWCRRLGQSVPSLVERGADEVHKLDVERANLHTALRWAVTDNRHPAEAVALAHDLLTYWYTTDEGADVAALIGKTLELPAPPTRERVELHLGAGHSRYWVGDFDGAAVHLQRALEMSRSLQSPSLIAHCLLRVAGSSETDVATALLAEAESIADELDEPALNAHAARIRGSIARWSGSLDDAVACFEQAIRLTPHVADRFMARLSLARIQCAQGRCSVAREQLLSAEREAADAGSRRLASVACLQLAKVELADGDRDRARQAFERSSLWDRPSEAYPAQRLEHDAVGALLRAEAGDLAGASDVARRLAGLPENIGDHVAVCDGWLIAGEILARSADPITAKACFDRVLRHRGGAMPDIRANALDAIAGILDSPDRQAAADRLAAIGAEIRARHNLTTPSWLTTAITGRVRRRHAAPRTVAGPTSSSSDREGSHGRC